MRRHGGRPVERETLDYLAMARRIIRVAGRRVANADEPELSALIQLHECLDQAVVEAIAGQRALGRSWAHIATAAGTTRQSAFEKWSARVAEYERKSA